MCMHVRVVFVWGLVCVHVCACIHSCAGACEHSAGCQRLMLGVGQSLLHLTL